MKTLRLTTLVSLILISGYGLAFAGDLDDGISKFTDDGISKYDDLGKADKNVSFIVQDALSKAAVGQKSATRGATGGDSGTAPACTKDANMNSAVFGAGSTVRDVTIVDVSSGDKNQVVVCK